MTDIFRPIQMDRIWSAGTRALRDVPDVNA